MISTENKLKVADYLQAGKRIEAIKFVREKLADSDKFPGGGSLIEATRIVQEIEEEYFPERKGFKFKGISSMDPGRIVGSVFSGLGAIFLIVVAILFWHERKTTADSSVVQGTVTSLDYDGDMAAPVIRYRFNGEKKVLRGTVWSSPPSYEIGETVELLINNNDPKDTIINSFFERYFLIMIFGLFGVIFGGIGLLVLIFLKN